MSINTLRRFYQTPFWFTYRNVFALQAALILAMIGIQQWIMPMFASEHTLAMIEESTSIRVAIAIPAIAIIFVRLMQFRK